MLRRSSKLLRGSGCRMKPNSRSLASTATKAAAPRVVVVGGGTGGLATAHQVLLAAPNAKVTVIEPSYKHYYQPGWTLVGGGILSKSATVKNESDLLNSKVKWEKWSAKEFRPEENTVVIEGGRRVLYDILVVATGIRVKWDSIPGLEAGLQTPEVTSNYGFDYCDKTNALINATKSGKALFTQPSTPIKCAGAPQKIMYLAEDAWRTAGVRDQIDIKFCTGLPVIFGVPKYAKALDAICKSRGMDVRLQHELVEIRSEDKEAVFKHDDKSVVLPYDMIHVTPHMGPHSVVKESPLADQAGYVEVDKETLQHVRFPNVFALGDCSSLPTSKTAAAITKQTPVLVANVIASWLGQPLQRKYNGYTSCPIPTKNGKLILAEFDYDKQPAETFPFDQSQERSSMFLLKKWVFPTLYWEALTKGIWRKPFRETMEHGRTMIGKE